MGVFTFRLNTIFILGFASSAHAADRCPVTNSAWVTQHARETLGSMLTDYGAQETVNDLARLGINEVNPVAVTPLGGRYFRKGKINQEYANPDDWRFRKDFDPLQAYVDKAHAKGMKVVPWFEGGLKLPANTPLAAKGWTTLSKTKSPTYEYSNGTKFAYLNPFHPDAQDYLIQNLVDTVENYDIDGIQLDDNFALPASAGSPGGPQHEDFGYDSYTLSEFAKRNDKNQNFHEWKVARMNDFMRKLSERVRAAAAASGKKDFKIQVAPNSPAYARKWYTQDVETWANKGYVDEVVFQNYRTTVDGFRSVLNDQSVQRVARKVPTRISIKPDMINGSPKASTPLIRGQLEVLKQAAKSGPFCPGVAWFTHDKMTSEQPGQELPVELVAPFGHGESGPAIANPPPSHAETVTKKPTDTAPKNVAIAAARPLAGRPSEVVPKPAQPPKPLAMDVNPPKTPVAASAGNLAATPAVLPKSMPVPAHKIAPAPAPHPEIQAAAPPSQVPPMAEKKVEPSTPHGLTAKAEPMPEPALAPEPKSLVAMHPVMDQAPVAGKVAEAPEATPSNSAPDISVTHHSFAAYSAPVGPLAPTVQLKVVAKASATPKAAPAKQSMAKAETPRGPASREDAKRFLPGTYVGRNASGACTVVITEERGDHNFTTKPLQRILVYNNAAISVGADGRQKLARDEFAELTIVDPSDDSRATVPSACRTRDCHLSAMKNYALPPQSLNMRAPASSSSLKLSVQESSYHLNRWSPRWIENGRVLRDIKLGRDGKGDLARLVSRESLLDGTFDGPADRADSLKSLDLKVLDQGVTSHQARCGDLKPKASGVTAPAAANPASPPSFGH